MRPGGGIKYWQCGNCGSSFLTREAASQHRCAAATPTIVEKEGAPEAVAAETKTKSG